MKTWQFYLVLEESELTDSDCESLHELGCDDGTVVTRNRVTHIVFDRTAESLEDAIRSATAQVRQAGFEVARVEMDALA